MSPFCRGLIDLGLLVARAVADLLTATYGSQPQPAPAPAPQEPEGA
jgi:hypothetical protein